ncbi:MAG: glycosyltransferase family 4 protein [bacterium]
MNIWLVDIFEQLPVDGFPLSRFRQLARELARRGHRVTWWASDFFHYLKTKRDGAQEPTALDPYWIRTLPVMPYYRNDSIRRLASHGRIAAEASRRLAGGLSSGSGGAGSAPELIVCSWTPPELAAVTTRFATRRGITISLDVPDPWPDSFANVLPSLLKPASPVLLWPHRQIGRWALRRAKGITAVSRTYLDWALALRKSPAPVQSSVFYPAARSQALPAKIVPGQPLRVVFAGTLGAMYDFDLMLEAARLVDARAKGTTHFYFAGSGPREEELLSRDHAANVEFTGPLSELDLDRLLRQCDVGLCCFPADAPTTLTTKLFHYMSYALPVMGTPQQEMVEFLAEHKVGLTISDAQGLAENLIHLGQQPQRWCEMSSAAKTFSLEHGLEQEMALMADFLLSLPR